MQLKGFKLVDLRFSKYSIIIFLLFLVLGSFGQSLEKRLKILQEKYSFTYKSLKTDSSFTEKFQITFDQPVDHNKPGGESFQQRVFISHIGFDNPVVFITEGYAAYYAARQFKSELSDILNANQVCVEHRYFGESIPKLLNWEYLNTYQAATDHHTIIGFLKEFYTGKFVNSGISKGGQTAMYHRYYYPEDVSATVGYVCPLNFSKEDKRVYSFLKNVADSAARQKVYNYQYEMLLNKSKYLPFFKEMSEEKNLSFSMGVLKAYELTVLEYSFAFWQWGAFSPDSIPTNITPKLMVEHLNRVAGIDWISEQGIARLQPFFYQAMTEIGFYGYEISAFQEIVSFSSNPTFDFTLPKGVTAEYNFESMQAVDCFIRHQANQMIFIYGEYDPWSSTATEPTFQNEIVKIVKPKGSHLTRISNLPENQKKEVITILKKWMGIN